MNQYHQEILEKIKKAGKGKASETASYLGRKHFHYGLSVPQRRAIAKEWAKANQDISLEDFLTLGQLLL